MTNVKPKIFIGLLLIIPVIALCIMFFSNKQPVSASEIVRLNIYTISDNIYNRVNLSSNENLFFSSNPYDYIVDNVYYDEIIRLGVSALPELEYILQTAEKSGLIEYIIAIAIEEISRANLDRIAGRTDELSWANSRQFASEWNDIKLNADESIMRIANSNELTLDEKMEQISFYGVVALPTLNRIIDSYDVASTDSRVYGTRSTTDVDAFMGFVNSFNLNDVEGNDFCLV